ncbi:hypothetical protein SUGI_0178270 [Cryptomeria japonica]|uniref:uncharacterized protein LOC131052354 n=1 Tax=Cryptomeria japonica TaxID=3369 RepID=UPI002408C131|nr:uncharacterized protein LOC131052354 [Cryptomeria japonica]GLJ11838.1 hypothetical protein SUGI_0178270 [Cryptomeria japonica]
MAESSAEGSKPQSAELLDSSEMKPGKHLQMKPAAAILLQNGGFFDFVKNASQEVVVRFFRQAIKQIEESRHINDYHFKLKPSKPSGFLIDVFYGESREGPEIVEPGSCISCNDSAPLFPSQADSVCAGECVLREFSDQPFVQCSLDAKARPGFIVTPVRHVQKLGDLDDQELFALWSVGVRALKSEGLNFTSMIVNHGSYRNLPHLHLKIWVDEREFGRAVVRWSAEKKKLLSILQRLASALPKKRAMCAVVQKGRKCRFGERCRFSH